MHKALFLDRDGVINVNHGYVHTPETFDFINGIFALCERFQLAGYKLVVVTNQSGIGRGMYTEDTFLALTQWMKACFAEHSVVIDAVYFSPFHPTKGQGKYRRESECRKPAPGMLLQAQRELDIDMASSVMIGDKASDMQAALSAGVGRKVCFSEDPAQIAKLSDDVEICASLAEIRP